MLKIILLCFLILANTVTAELVQVVSMFRHGARYPLNDYYGSRELQLHWGELTAVGMRQHYSLGRYLKAQYIDKLHFLSPSYNHSQVQFYSTQLNRTIMSLMSQINGLYGAGSGLAIPEGIKSEYLVAPFKYSDDTSSDRFGVPNGWPVIPHKTPGPLVDCPNLSALMKKNIQAAASEIQQMNLRYKPFFDKIQRLFNVSRPLDVTNHTGLADVITVYKFLGKSLPGNYTAADYANQVHLRDYIDFLKLGGDVSKAYSTGPLQLVLGDFDNRIKNPNQQMKWTFLSCHDTNIYPMMDYLNFSSHECIEQKYRFNKTTALNCEQGPQYAASVIFELHKNETQSGQFYTMIKYNGKYMNLCGSNSTQCDFTVWKNQVKADFVNVTEVCGAPASDESSPRFKDIVEHLVFE